MEELLSWAQRELFQLGSPSKGLGEPAGACGSTLSPTHTLGDTALLLWNGKRGWLAMEIGWFPRLPRSHMAPSFSRRHPQPCGSLGWGHRGQHSSWQQSLE